MAKSLKVLIAEDNPLDAELLVLELRRAGYELQWQRVDTEAAYLTALAGEPDLVLSDYEMPQFNGLRVLELLKQSGLEIPLIIVSGTIGEDTAVAAMKFGAADYLLKDRLIRLGPAVGRALEESRLRQGRKKDELALRASENRYHGTLDNMLEGCQIIGQDWRYIYLNEIAAWHGQRNKNELLGKTLAECYPNIINSKVYDVFQRCMIERKGARVENEFVYEDGKKAWFELSIQPVPEGIFILSLDITERKRAGDKIREQLDELLRWQDVMLDREDRVQALKAEVNELLAQDKLPPRYVDPAPPR